MFRKFSLASLLLSAGGLLTVLGIIAYITGKAALNIGGWFYGIPLILGGLALKITELKPVPYSQPTPPEIATLREKQATPTQKQLRKDVTRYRFGEDVHLDEALKRLELTPSKEERPVLVGVREVTINDAYTLVLEFESPFLPLEKWQEKQEKIEKFFGPGIRAELTQPQENRVDVALIAVPE
jgi:hypothetical protein